RVIPARHRLSVNAHIAEARIRTACLDAARPRRREGDVLGLLLIRAPGPHIVYLPRREGEEPPLEPDIPPLISPLLRLQRQRTPSDRADGSTKRHALIEVGERSGRHHVHRGGHRLAEAERQEIEVQTPARPFGLVEDAVAAAHHGPIAERPPREAKPW